jgi:hypothetical protein
MVALNWVDLTDPDLPFFNETTEGLLDTRIMFAHSTDGGENWSSPVLMDTAPFEVPTPVTGPVLRLFSGDLACQFELNKHYDDPAPWQHSSVMMFSSDGGRTWPSHAITSHDPTGPLYYWDQRPAVLADGRILDLFWTFDREAAVDLNIHACESFDHGRTWSTMWETGVAGQPAPPLSLPSGALAMVYVDRIAATAIRLRLSFDNGRTWPEQTQLRIDEPTGQSQIRRKTSMADAWFEMGDFSIGLPHTAALPEGRILVVYYAGTQTDYTDILWAVIET